ncbi:hypothetical protein EYF80_057265 [Liparis tanakae]|uniref:Uncharacterized protein n=1 Tax=Liparis tanakae TaxID=230148 RepID=A0A4Z2EUW6_9TELE|nr:hypothetical protein EYF80_057265 [Liparis tanakae]
MKSHAAHPELEVCKVVGGAHGVYLWSTAEETGQHERPRSTGESLRGLTAAASRHGEQQQRREGDAGRAEGAQAAAGGSAPRRLAPGLEDDILGTSLCLCESFTINQILTENTALQQVRLQPPPDGWRTS